MECQAGTWLTQRYKLLERLFQNGPLEYWRAQWQDPAGYGGEATLQVPLPIYLQHEQRQMQWQTQKHYIHFLQHENILRLYEIGQEQDTHFIASEPLDGINLYQILLFHKINKNAIPWPYVIAMLIEVCKGLDFAHNCQTPSQKSIFHGDLRPENILLTLKGFIKIQHFGHLHLWGDMQEAWPTEVLRRYAYAAPERWNEEKPYSIASDLYSLGVMLHELISGELPHKGTTLEILQKSALSPLRPSLREFDRSLHKTLCDLSQQLLHLQPNKRLPKARDVQFLLENVLLETGEEIDQNNLAALARRITPPSLQQNTDLTSSAKSTEPPAPATVRPFSEFTSRASSTDGMFASMSPPKQNNEEEWNPNSNQEDDEYDAGEATVIQFNPLNLPPAPDSLSGRDLKNLDLLMPQDNGFSDPFQPSSEFAPEQDKPKDLGEELFADLDFIEEIEEVDSLSSIEEIISMDDIDSIISLDDDDDIDSIISLDDDDIDSIISLDDDADLIVEIEEEDAVNLSSEEELDRGEATFLQSAPLPTWSSNSTPQMSDLFPPKEPSLSQSSHSSPSRSALPQQDYHSASNASLSSARPTSSSSQQPVRVVATSQANMQAPPRPPRRTQSIDDLSIPNAGPPTYVDSSQDLLNPMMRKDPFQNMKRKDPFQNIGSSSSFDSPASTNSPFGGPPSTPIGSPMALGSLNQSSRAKGQPSRAQEIGKVPKKSQGKQILFWVGFVLFLGGGSGTGTWFYLQTLPPVKSEVNRPKEQRKVPNQRLLRKGNKPQKRKIALTQKSVPAPRTTSSVYVPNVMPQRMTPTPMKQRTPKTRYRKVAKRPRARRNRTRRRSRKKVSQQSTPRLKSIVRPLPKTPTGFTGAIITVKPACTLFIGGDLKGNSTAFRISLTPGNYRFRCINRSKRVLHYFRVKIQTGQTTNYNKTLQKGTLLLSAKPWALISAKYLGILGKTDKKISLYQGSYKLTLYKNGSRVPGPGMREKRSVVIRPNQTTQPALVKFPVLDDE